MQPICLVYAASASQVMPSCHPHRTTLEVSFLRFGGGVFVFQKKMFERIGYGHAA